MVVDAVVVVVVVLVVVVEVGIVRVVVNESGGETVVFGVDKSMIWLGPYTESLHDEPQISFSFPEQGWSHSSGATGTNFESSFPQ